MRGGDKRGELCCCSGSEQEASKGGGIWGMNFQVCLQQTTLALTASSRNGCLAQVCFKEAWLSTTKCNGWYQVEAHKLSGEVEVRVAEALSVKPPQAEDLFLFQEARKFNRLTTEQKSRHRAITILRAPLLNRWC